MAYHSSGLLKPCSTSLPQGHQWRLEIPCSGLASLRTLHPALLSRVLPCLGEQSCARAPFFLSRSRGRRGGGESVFSHPLTRFLLFLSQKLSRISSLGLDVEDRLLLPSSGLKYKELQTLPPVLDELERKTAGRTKLAFQSCPALLVWRP